MYFNSKKEKNRLKHAAVRYCEADDIQRPENCDRQETLLRAKHVYTYKYTITSSSSITGATKSASGSKITCAVTVSVPRKCELTLQLSDCDLKERNSGEAVSYSDVEHANLFVQELERFPVYFQMNKGVVLENSVVISDEELIHVANIKRGLLSQLQFPYMSDIATTEEKDVFGSCPVEYSVLHDTPNTVRSKRNLRRCVIPQIFKKRFPFIRETGGFKETTISESIYPFVSEVLCDYTLGDDKTLDKVNCFQQQYFFPNAYRGDILATAMANISQVLELESFQMNKRLPRPSYNLDGRHVVQLKFDFGHDHFEQKGEAEILSVLADISEKFEAVDYEMVPSLYGDVLEMVRGTTLSVLVSVKEAVFYCGEDCSTRQKREQRFFLNAMASCGTDVCQELFVDCIQEGRVDRVESSLFLQSLASSGTATESLMKKLLHYCKSVGSTSCWLSLGTLLGKTEVGEDADITVDSTLGQTLDHVMEMLKTQCSAQQLSISQREMIKMIKTLENIGNKLVSQYDKSRSETAHKTIEQCIKNPNIPKRVLLAVLQLMDSAVYDSNFILPPSITELLFTLLKDVTKDMTLRATTFTLLMKTVDKDMIKRLVKYTEEPNTKQLKTYIVSNVQTMLENDDPTLKRVRSVWEEIRREDDTAAREIWQSGAHFGIGISKTFNLAHFFKLPITEYLGGQLYADIIFDPSAILFSRLKVSVNYFHGDQKYNVFEVTADVQGFDLLLETLLGKNDLDLMQLYGMYKQSKGEGQDGEGTLYDKFEKNMIRKVLEILEQVNHPKFPDFEFAVDLKMHGKHIHFLSLKDVMGYVRQIQAHGPPDQPPLMQKVIGLLKRGIQNKLVYGAREFAGLNKQMPTCAGLPMNMTVRVNVVDFLKVDLSADVSEYLKKTGPVTANWGLSIVLAAELKGQLIIPIAHYHSSGMQQKTYIGLQRRLQMGLTYSHIGQGKQSSVPFSGTLQLDIWNVDKEPETILYANGIMMIDHHSGSEKVQRDPALEKNYQRCFPDWLVAATGRSLCANFVYPDVKTSTTHAYFPLSGPFELNMVLEGADPKLDVHNLIWKFEVERKEGVVLRYICFTHYGKGSNLNRLIYNNMTYNSAEKSLKMDFAIPEAGIEYKWRLQPPISPGSGFEIMDFLWMQNWPYVGFFIKGYSKQDSNDPYSNSEKMFHANVTVPGIGVDFMLNRTFVNTHPELTSDLVMSFTYYCSQQRPLFYIFHLNPLHAAKNGDVTQIKIKNNIKTTVLSMTENKWKADDTFTLEYPGQTVTLVTDMRRESLTAHRNSVITYYEDGEIVTVMMTSDASHNQPASGRGMDVDYNMKIDGDDYSILVNGKFTGDFTDFSVNMNAEFTKSEMERRKKRSLEKIYEMFQAIEEATVAKIVQIEEAIIGKPKPAGEVEVTNADDQEKPKPQFSFPPMPQFPSIWDIPKWTATVDVKVKAQPVIGDSQGPPKGLTDQGPLKGSYNPGQMKGPQSQGPLKGPQNQGQGPPPMGAPKGVEFVWSMDAKHPWNGGYRVYAGTGKFGKNMVNNFKHFHFWYDLKDALHYTDLDGAAIDFPQFPNPIERCAHFHIEREAGHMFDTKLEATSPLINVTYLILFDYGAIRHHEPILHVRSSMSNLIVPFLNHDYEEFYTYELGYAKHIASFSHKLLTANIVSSFDYRTPEWLGLQNGTISIRLPMLNYASSKDFTNKFEMKRAPGYPRLTTTYSSSTYPDRTLIYETVMEHPKAISIHQYIKTETDSTDPALAWHTMVELRGSSTIQVTFEWQQIYDQALHDLGVTRKYQIAGYLQLVAEMMKKNMGLPIRDKKFILTESSQNLRGEDVGVLVKRGGGMDYLEETTGLGLAAITLSYANTGNRTGLQRWQARALPIPYLGP